MNDDQFTEQLQSWLDRFNDGEPQAENDLLMHVNDRLRVWISKELADHPIPHHVETTQDVRQEVLKRILRSLRRVTVTTPGEFFELVGIHIALALVDLGRRRGGPWGIATRQKRWPPSKSDSDEASHAAEEISDPKINATDHYLRPHSQSDSVEEADDEEVTDPAELDCRAELPSQFATNDDSWFLSRSNSVEEYDTAEDVTGFTELDRWTLLHEEIDRLSKEKRTLARLLIYNGLPKKKVAAMFGVEVRTVQKRWVVVKDRLHDRLRLEDASDGGMR